MTSETIHHLHLSEEQSPKKTPKTGASEKKTSDSMSRRKFIIGSFSLVAASGLSIQNELYGSSADADHASGPSGPKLKIIDTHTHFYDPSRAIPVGRDIPVPWPSPKSEHLYKPTLPPEWEALATPLGITGTVVVEAGTNWLEDNDWVLKLSNQYPFIVGLIGNLSGTAVENGIIVPVWDNLARYRQEIRRLAKNPIFRGIRVPVRNISGDKNNGRYPHFEALAEAGLVLDINGGPAADIVALAKTVPTLKIIVNHMFGFKPQSWSDPNIGSTDKWKSDIIALSGSGNIMMKVSGLVEGFDSLQTDPSMTLEKCQGALNHVYKSFGADRLLFGTNWPVSEPKGKMYLIKEIVYRFFEPYGKKVLARIFSENAIAVYQCVIR